MGRKWDASSLNIRKTHYTVGLFFIGATGGTRTLMSITSVDFESTASTIPPPEHVMCLHIITHRP